VVTGFLTDPATPARESSPTVRRAS
jgi:hypothetical protein